MGCKCASKNEEEEEEIAKKGLEDGNLDNEENDENNTNLKKNNIDLLSLNEQIGTKDNDLKDNLEMNNENDLNDKYADYPYKIVELINNIREDPVGYADTIEQAIQNIVLEEDNLICRKTLEKKCRMH